MIRCFFFLSLFGFLQASWGQSSAENLNRAQEGIVDQSWPKKPGNQVSALSGKMFESKDIEIKRYTSSESSLGQKIYDQHKESRLSSGRFDSSKESNFQGRESSRFEGTSSSMDGTRNSDYSEGKSSALQNRDGFEAKEWKGRDGPDWVSRSSSKFQGGDGGLVMYEGRLTRVRERVNQQDPTQGRDLGPGRRENFQPNEVQKMIEERKRPMDVHQATPEEIKIKAAPEGAFQPVTADNSPSSP